MGDELEFQPKAGGETWIAYASKNDFSGYDIAFMLDKKNGTRNSGWVLALGVDADCSIVRQTTCPPGSASLGPVECTTEKFSLPHIWGGPNVASEGALKS